MKTLKDKELLLEQLRKTPIVQIACGKINVGRATYYRWRRNQEFASKADRAITEGVLLVSDVAESQLLTAIRDGNLTACVFWLRSHHPAYNTKLEITAQLKNGNEKLTPEQEALVTKALKLAVMLPDRKETEEKNK